MKNFDSKDGSLAELIELGLVRETLSDLSDADLQEVAGASLRSSIVDGCDPGGGHDPL